MTALYHGLMRLGCLLMISFALVSAATRYDGKPPRNFLILAGIFFVFLVINERQEQRSRRRKAEARVAEIEAEENLRDAVKYRNQLLREKPVEEPVSQALQLVEPLTVSSALRIGGHPLKEFLDAWRR